MDWNLQALADDARWRKLLAWLPSLVTAIAVAWGAWLASGLTWQVVETVTTVPVLPPATSRSNAGANDDAGVDVDQLANWHLFGTAEVAEQAAVETIDAPETRLNLQLQGILASSEEGPSLAIIRSGQQEKVYAKGDTVAGGASLHAVLADRVILRRSGQLETLRLPRLGADIEGIEVSDVPEPAGTSRRGLSGLRDQVRNDPSALAEMLRYSPVMQDGQLHGYRLYPGRDRAAFSEAGLRPGDIVTAINGTSLSNPADAIKLMSTLTEADTISLTIERGGEEMTVGVNMTQ